MEIFGGITDCTPPDFFIIVNKIIKYMKLVK
jgi:hypothetical protein